MKSIGYNKIGQYRSVIKDIHDDYPEGYPTFNMQGTVKVHGTNASVIISPDGTQHPQSRNSLLSVKKDNAGFAVWHYSKIDFFTRLREHLWCDCAVTDDETVIVYGEFAGKGIQSGVAVSQVDKFFYIFGIKAIEEDGNSRWLVNYTTTSNYEDIIFSSNILMLSCEIDFNEPSKMTNALINITETIEKECPVGMHYGVSGIGEGIVWEHITNSGKSYKFKVKGEKHSVTKVKKLVAVDVEKIASIEEFVNYAVTNNRLIQAFREVCNNDPDRKFLGKFIKWVSDDVAKEEADTLLSNGLVMKDVGRSLSLKSRNWFFSKENDGLN